MNEIIWISWQNHRRTEGLCSFFDIKWFCLVSQKKKVLRYVGLVYRTLRILIEERPSTVIVQNPSIVLTLLTCTIKRLFRFDLIVDAHNEGVIPYENNSFFFRTITRWCHSSANLTIVTNNELSEVIVNNGGRSFVLPDRLPDVAPDLVERRVIKNNIILTVISTFAKDEPLESIFLSLGQVPGKIRVFVTGNDRKCTDRIRKLAPDCVTFTGFISDKDYWNLLARSDVIVDLTTMKNCLVCGLYEALSVGVPVIITDDVSSKLLFSEGVVFSKLDVDSIAASITRTIEENRALRISVQNQKESYSKYWNKQALELGLILKGQKKLASL